MKTAGIIFIILLYLNGNNILQDQNTNESESTSNKSHITINGIGLQMVERNDTIFIDYDKGLDINISYKNKKLTILNNGSSIQLSNTGKVFLINSKLLDFN
ncbi:hypothetical protein [Bacteroides sp. 519]|uniref:hypothetical protein n=1 Tax=Bacteroides sp. 519 TaxID=2302937 RepID=UPI0013D0C942|nr:hypothetical protein [Bacteroides sp. 519]NDV59781.1 hypothetical protein [Bacteroides sp. 519]